MDFFAFKKFVSFMITPVPLTIMLLTFAFVATWLKKVSAWVRWPLSLAWFIIVLIPLSPIPERGLIYFERMYPAYEPIENRPIEQILVLACYVVDEPGLPVTSQHHACSKGRLIEALRIWHLHPNAEILLSGGPLRFKQSSMAQKGADFLQSLGVPNENLVVIPKGRDTNSEALAYRSYLTSARPVLVTSGTHMKRAVRLFAKHGMAVIPAPAEQLVLSLPDSEHDRHSNWKSWIPTAATYYRMERLWYATLANALVTIQSFLAEDNEPVPANEVVKREKNARPKSSDNSSETKHLSEYQAMLDESRHEEALTLYEQKLKEGQESQYRLITHRYLNAHLVGQPLLVLELSEQFIQLESDNPQLHFLALWAATSLRKYAKATDELIYFRDAFIPESISDFVKQLRTEVLNSYTEQLLIGSDPELIEHAIWQFEYLNELQYANRLRNKLAKSQRDHYLAGLYPIELPLKAVGQHHFVEVTLNDEITVELLLDTGATYVAISKEILDRMRYEVKREGILFNTANGQTLGSIVSLESFSVGEIRLENFEVSTNNDYGSRAYSGLLGQNFLSLFDWKIDQEESVLHLAPK